LALICRALLVLLVPLIPLAIRLVPLVAAILIHLPLLIRGLLLAILLTSLVLGPHHGPVVLRLSVIHPVLVLAYQLRWLSETQFGFWLYHHWPYCQFCWAS
jgi:hypothetical protein